MTHDEQHELTVILEDLHRDFKEAEKANDEYQLGCAVDNLIEAIFKLFHEIISRKKSKKNGAQGKLNLEK